MRQPGAHLRGLLCNLTTRTCILFLPSNTWPFALAKLGLFISIKLGKKINALPKAGRFMSAWMKDIANSDGESGSFRECGSNH